MPTMVVSKLAATVGSETENIRLAVPAKKLPSAALISSSQLMRGSMPCERGIAGRMNQPSASGPPTSRFLTCRLPMLLYQLDPKPQRAFALSVGDLFLVISQSTEISYSFQFYRVHAS